MRIRVGSREVEPVSFALGVLFVWLILTLYCIGLLMGVAIGVAEALICLPLKL